MPKGDWVMRVSIVAPDNMICVDNTVGLKVDCSQLVIDNIHAVQWYDDHGEIEFKSEYLAKEKRWHQEPNKHITDFSMFQDFVDEWRLLKAAYDAEEKRVKEEMEEQRRVAAELEARAKVDYEKMLQFFKDNPPPLDMIPPPKAE